MRGRERQNSVTGPSPSPWGGRRVRTILIAALSGVLGGLPLLEPGPALAQESGLPTDVDLPSRDQPSLITADEIVNDEELGIVTARGNVEISQGERVLIADVVNYNTRTNTVTASGNVTLIEPSGDVVFADYVELQDDLKEGFIRDIRVLLSDRSRLAAASGQRSGGNLTSFNKAVFSPCELCRDNPDKAPLWQLKADRVEHDQEERTIRYYDASMEIFGIPIAYTPYLEHPDPTVKRKSGFLAPTFGGSENLGATLQVPYFWVIDDTKDVTFEPIVTTEQGVVAAGQYRQLLEQGEFEINASGTLADREKSNGKEVSDAFRGHIDAFGRYDINETWRTGADIARTTDDTYLRLYDFSNERSLTSRAFLEGFRGRNYASANAFLYQGLREDDNNDENPIVAPLLDFNYISEPGEVGGLYRADLNFLTLSRISGRDVRRASFVGSYEIPYTGPIGDIYKLTARLQTDGYFTNDVDPETNEINPQDGQDSDFDGRFFPQLAFDWRYPWIQQNEQFDQVIEPRFQFVTGPGDHNPNGIPNEDSLGFEFDDANLFSLNRFPGLDRVDSGTRITYGFDWSAVTPESRSISAFLGQSYRFSGNDDKFSDGSGLDDHLSDFVGRVEVNPIKEVDLLYRFQFDKDDFNARRNEVSARVGTPALNLNLSYFFVSGNASSEEFNDREELATRLNSRLTDNWSLFLGQRRDLKDDRQLTLRGGLTYQDECFLMEAALSREKFSDRELDPETKFFVRLVFKHLGQVEGST